MYGLIHARYVLTSAGLNAVLEKFYNAEYGRCPRVFCKDQPVLPAAISDIPHEEAVKVSKYYLKNMLFFFQKGGRNFFFARTSLCFPLPFLISLTRRRSSVHNVFIQKMRVHNVFIQNMRV